MDQTIGIISVDADNLDQHGFFCYMSKRKAPGYKQKRDWLEARFAEGLKIKMVHPHYICIFNYVQEAIYQA